MDPESVSQAIRPHQPSDDRCRFLLALTFDLQHTKGKDATLKETCERRCSNIVTLKFSGKLLQTSPKTTTNVLEALFKGLGGAAALGQI